MVYDCFTFRDELDILEIRLRILDKYVDKFVISEADRTHTNQPKDYVFHKNKDRFSKWKDKIVYLPIKLDDTGLDFSKKDTSYTPNSPAWVFENQQRNALRHVFGDVKAGDTLMIGDLDEIPHPNSITSMRFSSNMYRACEHNFYYYYFNNKSMGPRDAVWNGTVIMHGFARYDFTPQEFRDRRNNFQTIGDRGWHLSYMGGKEMIKRKIQTIAHTEFNKEEFYSDDNIEACLNEGRDVFMRPGMNFRLVDLNEEYPPEVREILLDYPNFIK